MKRLSTLIVGCGYLGRRVGRLLSERGERVYGTTRNVGRSDELAALGIEAVVADVLAPESLVRFPGTDRTLYCVGFDRTAGVPIRDIYVEGLRHALGRLLDRTGMLVYAGSTGVYGQADGSWVDEDSPTVPRTESGRACLEAESVIRVYEAEGLASTILRFSGLYGPGRIIRREAISKGEPIAADPAHWLNLIHIDDATSAAIAALDRGEGGSLYIASDDRPVLRSEFYGLAAELLHAPAPRFEPPPPGGGSGRDESNKRVSNRRMREGLGVALAYPEIVSGLPAALGST